MIRELDSSSRAVGLAEAGATVAAGLDDETESAAGGLDLIGNVHLCCCCQHTWRCGLRPVGDVMQRPPRLRLAADNNESDGYRSPSWCFED